MLKKINDMIDYHNVILVQLDDVAAERYLNENYNRYLLDGDHLYGIIESGDFSDIDEFSDVLVAGENELVQASLNSHVKAIQGTLF